VSVSLAGIKITCPWQSGATHSAIHSTEEGVRFTNRFVHWILHPPIEINEAHVWQKLESPDQEYLLMRSAGFNCYLLCPMTIQHMEYFLPVPANNGLVCKIYDFLTVQLHSYRGDSGERV
jgi:hypothetical protein